MQKKFNISHLQIVRYEIKGDQPPADIHSRIADIFDVSLDYLTGKVNIEMNKDIQKLILKVSKFEDENRKNIFSVIEAFVAKRKIQSIL